MVKFRTSNGTEPVIERQDRLFDSLGEPVVVPWCSAITSWRRLHFDPWAWSGHAQNGIRRSHEANYRLFNTLATRSVFRQPAEWLSASASAGASARRQKALLSQAVMNSMI